MGLFGDGLQTTELPDEELCRLSSGLSPTQEVDRLAIRRREGDEGITSEVRAGQPREGYRTSLLPRSTAVIRDVELQRRCRRDEAIDALLRLDIGLAL